MGPNQATDRPLAAASSKTDPASLPILDKTIVLSKTPRPPLSLSYIEESALPFSASSKGMLALKLEDQTSEDDSPSTGNEDTGSVSTHLSGPVIGSTTVR